MPTRDRNNYSHVLRHTSHHCDCNSSHASQFMLASSRGQMHIHLKVPVCNWRSFHTTRNHASITVLCASISEGTVTTLNTCWKNDKRHKDLIRAPNLQRSSDNSRNTVRHDLKVSVYNWRSCHTTRTHASITVLCASISKRTVTTLEHMLEERQTTQRSHSRAKPATHFRHLTERGTQHNLCSEAPPARPGDWMSFFFDKSCWAEALPIAPHVNCTRCINNAGWVRGISKLRAEFLLTKMATAGTAR